MGSDRAERQAVWMLALGQMLGYACFFYLFAALILYWRADLHWGDGLLASGLTLAVVISAGLAPLAGRAVDRGQATGLMVGGAGIGALSLALLAVAQTPAVYLMAWAGLGVAQAASLYEVCFALMIRRFGGHARAAITRITLIGGFASTLAFPMAAALADAIGWRGAVWAAVVVTIGVVMPLNLIGTRRLAQGGLLAAGHSPAQGPAWRDLLRHWPFLRLALLFSLVALCHWMLLAFLRPILADMGVASAYAVMAAATIGPAQVAGRLVLMGTGDRVPERAALIATLASFVLAPALLAFGGVAMPLVFGFALLQGAANGVMTILRPLLTARDIGAEGFGVTAGLLSIPTLAASAVAPMLGAALMAMGGWPLVVAAAAVFAGLALALALCTPR